VRLAAHLRYARYLARHKWHVLVACCRLGVPWRGLVHDLSKLTPTEWLPYVRHFYGDRPSPRDASGAYDPLAVGDDFDRAWLSHQHHNGHHWQHWILHGDGGCERAMAMPRAYLLEMVADWIGAGKALGKPDLRAWYEVVRERIVLHPETRREVEELVGRVAREG
jgi:hypothetical protein